MEAAEEKTSAAAAGISIEKLPPLILDNYSINGET